MNINLTIELKKEYMSQLTNILNPLIYTGLQSIYNDSLKTTKSQNILTDFQSRLIIIKDWSQCTIEQEVKRILDNTISIPWFFDLIQAIFKINQIILGLDELININIKTFIYQIYIECSREFWMNPYLFYHAYTPLEMKHNTNMILTKITCCIENAIRRLLPMGIILDKFLGEKATNKKNFNINEIYNMPLLLNINLKTQPVNKNEIGQIDINNIIEMFRNSSLGKKSTDFPPEVNEQSIGGNIENNTNFSLPCRRHENESHNKYYTNDQNHNNSYKQLENKSLDIKNVVHDTNHKPIYSNTSSDNKIQKNTDLRGGSLTSDTNNKILNIINKQNFKLSESHDNKKKSHKSDKGSDSSAILKKIINESINTNHTASPGLNSMVKNKLLKNLESDSNMIGNKKIVNSDSESAIRNPHEKYQDFFSNSEIKKDSLQNVEKNDNTKNKFFNNYLNV
jgi:hypothetical protein